MATLDARNLQLEIFDGSDYASKNADRRLPPQNEGTSIQTTLIFKQCKAHIYGVVQGHVGLLGSRCGVDVSSEELAFNIVEIRTHKVS